MVKANGRKSTMHKIVTCTKVNINSTRRTAMECSLGKAGMFTKAITMMTREMASERCSGSMGLNMKGSGVKGSSMDKEK